MSSPVSLMQERHCLEVVALHVQAGQGEPVVGGRPSAGHDEMPGVPAAGEVAGEESGVGQRALRLLLASGPARVGVGHRLQPGVPHPLEVAAEGAVGRVVRHAVVVDVQVPVAEMAQPARDDALQEIRLQVGEPVELHRDDLVVEGQAQTQRGVLEGAGVGQQAGARGQALVQIGERAVGGGAVVGDGDGGGVVVVPLGHGEHGGRIAAARERGRGHGDGQPRPSPPRRAHPPHGASLARPPPDDQGWGVRIRAESRARDCQTRGCVCQYGAAWRRAARDWRTP